MLIEHIYKQDPAIDAIDGKFLFFCNSKVATQSTVRGVLKGRARTSAFSPGKYKRIIQSYTLSDIQRLFKFTIVRNPWDRVVSRFFFLQQIRHRRLYKKETFSSFVKSGLFIKSHIDNHIDFQYPKIFFNGGIFIDFIGRFENMKRDWRIISSVIGCNPKLPYLNESKHEPYQSYYDEETKAIVADYYRKDIELLGYSF